MLQRNSYPDSIFPDYFPKRSRAVAKTCGAAPMTNYGAVPLAPSEPVFAAPVAQAIQSRVSEWSLGFALTCPLHSAWFVGFSSFAVVLFFGFHEDCIREVFLICCSFLHLFVPLSSAVAFSFDSLARAYSFSNV
jgi:hypothetical protein